MCSRVGSIGAGRGTQIFGWKGGIGSSSRVVTVGGSQYTVGVLVQTNYGGNMDIIGVPVHRYVALTHECCKAMSMSLYRYLQPPPVKSGDKKPRGGSIMVSRCARLSDCSTRMLHVGHHRYRRSCKRSELAGQERFNVSGSGALTLALLRTENGTSRRSVAG